MGRGCVMRDRVFVVMVVVLFLLVLPGLALGAEKFGMIFDIMGNAALKSAEGDVTELKRSKHILQPVKVGDTIEVSGAGRVLVVSIKDKKGYELLSDTTAKVQSTGMAKLRGTVRVKEGYNVPAERVKVVLGGIVMRDATRGMCIKTVSPLNTSVLTLTPNLRWKNTCKGSKIVTVMVLKEGDVVFEIMTEKNSVTIPAGLLKEGQSYRWLIDGGPASAILGGTLHTLNKDFADMILQKKASFAQQGAELPERLSFLFLLMAQNLVELAEAEIDRLQGDFPENAFIQELK
jgi:hypothetical protein